MYWDWGTVGTIFLIICVVIVGIAIFNNGRTQQECQDPMLNSILDGSYDRQVQEMMDRLNAQYAAERAAEKPKWSQEGYDQKLSEVLAKYEVSEEEWKTNTGHAWTNKWAIIKEMNAWQMERLESY